VVISALSKSSHDPFACSVVRKPRHMLDAGRCRFGMVGAEFFLLVQKQRGTSVVCYVAVFGAVVAAKCAGGGRGERCCFALVMTCTRLRDDLQLVILLYAGSVWSKVPCRVLCSQGEMLLLSCAIF